MNCKHCGHPIFLQGPLNWGWMHKSQVYNSGVLWCDNVTRCRNDYIRGDDIYHTRAEPFTLEEAIGELLDIERTLSTELS